MVMISNSFYLQFEIDYISLAQYADRNLFPVSDFNMGSRKCYFGLRFMQFKPRNYVLCWSSF